MLGGVGVGRARAEDDGREVGVVEGVGEVLGLEAEAGVLAEGLGRVALRR